jgi:formylmethanofuran dehydrogenase subunit E
MKFLDYGKMAATYLNLKTGKAVRIVAREETREKAKEYLPEIENKYMAQIEAYKVMSDQELFSVTEVNVHLKPEDMPGRPLKRTKCDLCGEYVQDMREVHRDEKFLCKPCAEGGYYTVKSGDGDSPEISKNLDRYEYGTTLRLLEEPTP